MRFLLTTRAACAVAAAAGVALIGASLGGMARVDAELAAATPPAPAIQFDRVTYDAGGQRVRDRGCPAPQPRGVVRPEL
jgi:hypothetical protein